MNATLENNDRQIQIYSPNPYLINKCPICLENPTNKTTGCGHHFCGECIDSWTREHSTCPICRANITNCVTDETHTDWENRIRIYGMLYNLSRYPYKTGLDFEFISKSAGCKVSSSIKAMSFINDIGF